MEHIGCLFTRRLIYQRTRIICFHIIRYLTLVVSGTAQYQTVFQFLRVAVIPHFQCLAIGRNVRSARREFIIQSLRSNDIGIHAVQAVVHFCNTLSLLQVFARRYYHHIGHILAMNILVRYICVNRRRVRLYSTRIEGHIFAI